MNTGTAAAIITERGIPLPTLGPKPTRAEVLEAIASSTFAKQLASYEESKLALEGCEEEIRKKIRKHLAKSVKTASIAFENHYSGGSLFSVAVVRIGKGYGGSNLEEVQLLAERTRLEKERQQLKRPDFGKIHEDVKRADRLHRIERVQALTKDPEIAAKLAQVGAEMLAKLTP